MVELCPAAGSTSTSERTSPRWISITSVHCCKRKMRANIYKVFFFHFHGEGAIQVKKKKKMGEVTKKDKSLHPIPIVFCAYFCYITKAPPPKKKMGLAFRSFYVIFLFGRWQCHGSIENNIYFLRGHTESIVLRDCYSSSSFFYFFEKAELIRRCSKEKKKKSCGYTCLERIDARIHGGLRGGEWKIKINDIIQHSIRCAPKKMAQEGSDLIAREKAGE